MLFADHGIEMPEQRLAAGKAESGLIRLEAQHRAGMLAITISDDGGGIDRERLRRKIVERCLASADMAQSLSEAELLEFLFLPGFSTAAADLRRWKRSRSPARSLASRCFHRTTREWSGADPFRTGASSGGTALTDRDRGGLARPPRRSAPRSRRR